MSCPWKVPQPDDTVTGKYHINRDVGMQEIIVPPDTVLDRSIKTYSMPFWIDKLCIDQLDSSIEKQVAIDSMDLVYKYSNYTVGLLFIRIDDEAHVNRLCDLLLGHCVKQTQTKDGFSHFKLRISLDTAKEVMLVILWILSGADGNQLLTRRVRRGCFDSSVIDGMGRSRGPCRDTQGEFK